MARVVYKKTTTLFPDESAKRGSSALKITQDLMKEHPEWSTLSWSLRFDKNPGEVERLCVTVTDRRKISTEFIVASVAAVLIALLIALM